MRVFDVHVHIQPWEMLKPEVMSMLADPSHANAKDVLASADNVVRFLDAEGVDRICCINYVSPDVMGFTRETNDWIANFTRDHQLFSPNAYLGELWQLAEIYRECEERQVPVMFHTGTSVFPRARNVFADPMPIDDVANDFPRLPIILAHAGRPLYGETAFFLARRHPNVRLDISGIPPKALLRYVPRVAELADKILWGTDWPSPGVVSPRKNVEDFLALGLGADVGRKILWDNAARLFQ